MCPPLQGPFVDILLFFGSSSLILHLIRAISPPRARAPDVCFSSELQLCVVCVLVAQVFSSFSLFHTLSVYAQCFSWQGLQCFNVLFVCIGSILLGQLFTFPVLLTLFISFVGRICFHNSFRVQLLIRCFSIELGLFLQSVVFVRLYSLPNTTNNIAFLLFDGRHCLCP